MKLYLNYKGPKIGTGKIDLENVNELTTLENALKHYKEYLLQNDNNSSDYQAKIEELDKFVNNLRIDNGEQIVKKFESSIGISLNEFLRKKRLQKNWSIKDISKKLNIKPSYYNNIEKETLSPPAETLIEIFSILDVLPKIKVKLYEYIPAVEYYFDSLKIAEVYFKCTEEYVENCKILKLKLNKESIEEFINLPNILSL